MAERPTSGGSGADVLDGVHWDYDPEGEQLSPLVSTERYFRDFPWEPAELMEPGPPPPPTPESGAKS